MLAIFMYIFNDPQPFNKKWSSETAYHNMYRSSFAPRNALLNCTALQTVNQCMKFCNAAVFRGM